MPMIRYESKRLSEDVLGVIGQANTIIGEYAEQGYDLTLRQLYYQFVARDWLPNTVQSYKRLGRIVSDGRRAGLIDWDRIVDRTRFLRTVPTWDDPPDMMQSVAEQFTVDFWQVQKYRPEVWIEKDALVGVLEVACRPWQCPYFSCRGYSSDSESWAAARRMRDWQKAGQVPVIIHLGDHDPSGIDMSRDITERIRLFSRSRVEVRRIALNMDQVEEYGPPPNPAKESDSRFADYEGRFGSESWELDALNPTIIGQLIAAEMLKMIDGEKWEESQSQETEGRRLLTAVAANWQKLTRRL